MRQAVADVPDGRSLTPALDGAHGETTGCQEPLAQTVAKAAHGRNPRGTGMVGKGWTVQVVPPFCVVHKAADCPEGQFAVPPATQFWAVAQDKTETTVGAVTVSAVVQVLPPSVVLMMELPVVA